MKYHLPCLVKVKREIEKSKLPQTTNVKFGQLLSDLEILEIVETEINDIDRDVVMNMNDINQMYTLLLHDNELPVTDTSNYKKYLKQLVLDNLPDVQFSRHPDKTKPEQVLSTRSKERLLAGSTSTDLKEDLKLLMRAAKILRRDIATSRPWKFHGTFANYEPPALLKTFCTHAVQGTGKVKSMNREESVNRSASVLAQHFVGAYKSDRQVSYKPKQNDGAFRQHFETPLSVGLGLDVHKNTRSKTLVEKLGMLDLAVSYKKSHGNRN